MMARLSSPPPFSSSSRPLSSSSASFSMRSFITHFSMLLIGIFISTFISTIKLTNRFSNDVVNNAGGDVRSILNNFVATAGGKSSELRDSPLENGNSASAVDIESLKNSLHNEQKKTRELEDAIAKLKNGASDQTSNPQNPSSDTSSSIDSDFQQQIVNSYNNYYKHTPRSHDFCSILPQPTPTTLSLWGHHLPHILNASKHNADYHQFEFHDFTALLLHFFTPDRLQRSVKTLPLDWTPVERSLDVLHRRLAFIRTEMSAYRTKRNLSPEDPIPPDEMKKINENPKAPRKLHLLVMGGSVTMGVVCHINPVTTQTGKYTRRACAWPGRLSEFFSNLFGYDLIHTHTIALGGTNTESGITMWDYNLLPDVPYPDIVINAYATNDMHYNSVMDAISRNKTLAQSVMDLNQGFVRQVLTPKKECGHAPPLLLYLDDYLGNEQNEVMTTIMSSQTINLLSGYYGIGSMSYADAVRDLVYGDNREWWFSSNWYEKEQYQRAVHPHMGMHISALWVVAFNLMNLVATYCSLPEMGVGGEHSAQLTQGQQSQRRRHAGLGQNSNGLWNYGYEQYHGLPPLRYPKQLAGGPKDKPRGIPPPLSDDLSLEHISDLWRKSSESNAHLLKSREECFAEGHISGLSDDAPRPHPCIFSWVAKLERHLDNPKRLTEKLKPFITSNQGWSAADDNEKLGWVPSSGLGSKFTMELKKLSQPVRAVTWMVMRSYGEKWEGSKMRVEVWCEGKLLASEDIVGFHDKKTSETYNVKMVLLNSAASGGGGDSTPEDGARIGSDLKVTFELIGGTTFKISGMALCDH